MWSVVNRWYQARRLHLLMGVGLWLALAAAAGIYAHYDGRPVWETVVTWDEWVVSILLLPWLGRGILDTASHMAHRQAVASSLLAGGNVHTTREATSSHEGKVLRRLHVVAGIMFALDLLVRLVLGLGWKPFL